MFDKFAICFEALQHTLWTHLPLLMTDAKKRHPKKAFVTKTLVNLKGKKNAFFCIKYVY